MEYIKINNTILCCYESGKIEKYYKNNWKLIKEQPHVHINGYKTLRCRIEKKQYTISRILACCFLGFDMNSSLLIDHIDKNSLNNHISNLRIVTNQQNQFNTNAKGYTKHQNGWRSQIVKDGIRYSKCFKSEQEAKKWYEEQKELLHYI